MKNQETIPVLVKLTSISRDEEMEMEPMRMLCRGELKKTPSGYLLRYQEVQEADEPSEVVTGDVIMSLSAHRVTMSRPGEYGTVMVFVRQQRFESLYHTPYGDMHLGIYPMEVFCQADDHAGRVHLEYQLDMQGNFSAVNVIDLEYLAGEET